MTSQSPDWPRCGVLDPGSELDAASWERFFDHSTALLGILDQGGVIRRANASLAAASGEPVTSLVGRAFLTLLDSADHGTVTGQLDRLANGAGHAGFEARLAQVSPVGAERWVEWLLLKDDTAGLMLLSGRVVTAEKQLAARLAVSEERQAYLLRLSDAMRALESADDVLRVATRMLVEQLGLSRSLYAEVVSQPPRTYIEIRAEYAEPGLATLAGRYRVDATALATPLNEPLRAGQTLVVTDATTDPRHSQAERAANAAIDIAALVAVPLVKGGDLRAILGAYQREPRAWTADEVRLIEATAERTWAELERARAELERAEAHRATERALLAREEFLSIAAHELRNPVTAVKIAGEMMARAASLGRLDQRRLERFAVAIVEASNRLTRLTNDLLDGARLRAGRLSIEREPSDLGDLVREEVRRRFLPASDHQASLVIDEVVLSVDPDRIRQVIDNLLDNAIKYAPAGGTIAVRLSRSAEGVRFSVRDDGIGIPPEMLEAIFEPFGRADNASQRHLPGMGLGLYICRRIVEAHGGRLWAESAGEGQGATLSFVLPWKNDETKDGEPATPNTGGG